MEHKVGYTKTGKIIFQDDSNGNVKIRENESDNTAILYPYIEWIKIKDAIADYSTISYEYNPKHPNKLMKVGSDSNEADVNKNQKEFETEERKKGFVKIIFIVTIIILFLAIIRDVFFPKKES